MDKLIIETEDELFDSCDYAKEVFSFADTLAKNDGNNWFFEKCYANLKDGVSIVIFKSYIDEFKDYVLPLKVIKNSEGKYDISIQKIAA